MRSSARGVAVVERRAAAGDGEQRLPGRAAPTSAGRRAGRCARARSAPCPRPARGSGPPSTAARPPATAASGGRRGPAAPWGGRALDDPRVLAAAALRRVDDQRALAQRHPGQPALGHVARAPGEDERPQVDVAGLEPAVAQRRARSTAPGSAGPPSCAGRPRWPRPTPASSLVGGPVADQQPVAAALVGRLHDQLAEVGRARSRARRRSRQRYVGTLGEDAAPRRGSSGSRSGTQA